MTKCAITAVMVVVFGGCDAKSQDAPEAQSIFRAISFNPYATLSLGDTLPANAPPMTRHGNVFAISKQGFGGADSIYVELDQNRRVQELQFVYGTGSTFDALVLDYEDTLGPPLQREASDSLGTRILRAIWQDERTEFIVSETTGSEARRLSSALLNRSDRQFE